MSPAEILVYISLWMGFEIWSACLFDSPRFKQSSATFLLARNQYIFRVLQLKGEAHLDSHVANRFRVNQRQAVTMLDDRAYVEADRSCHVCFVNEAL